MFRSVLVATVVHLFISFCEASSVNYCGAAMCGKTDKHTFCQFPEGPSQTCSGYIEDRLSDDEKTRIVVRMNLRRSEVAQGKLNHLPPASNMLRVHWVEELAREAQIWADQCKPPSYPEQHDVCRDLYAITVGQCVASVVGEAPGLRPETMVDMWFLQGSDYRATLFMQSMDSKKSSADFEQMMWAHTYLVGCARSRFMMDIDGRQRTVIRLVCNFAPRGPGSGPLWTPGAPAAACPPSSRPDPTLPGLCSFHRDETFNYDVNNTRVVKELSVLDTVFEIEQNDSLNFRGSLDQIYLTKIMVASMRNEAANNSYAVEKQDVFESTLSENTTLLHTADKKQNAIDEIIEKKLKETPTARTTRKEMSTIGRPKSYNIDELNVAKDFENGTRTTRPIEAVKDDAYSDYDFEEVLIINDVDYNSSITESNGTTGSEKLTEEITQMITATEEPSINMITTEITNSNTGEVKNDTNSNTRELKNDTLYIDEDDNTTASYVQNDILKRLIELSKETENNPSNPETAKQLQEALDQMEHALESPTPRKVRRELRSQSDQGAPPSTTVPEEKSYGQRLKDIGVPDSAPVISIISKYGTPFMEKYRSLFARSAASKTTLTLVLSVFVLVSIAL